MFDPAKAKDVVTEILKTLEKLAIPLKLMLSLGNRWPKCEQVYTELIRRRLINS